MEEVPLKEGRKIEECMVLGLFLIMQSLCFSVFFVLVLGSEWQKKLAQIAG